eukprot:scaffold127796_cov30-Phaeocystis_antarctica.AAC.2
MRRGIRGRDSPTCVVMERSTSSFHLRSKNRITCRNGPPLWRQTHPTRLSQIAIGLRIRSAPSSPSIQSFPSALRPLHPENSVKALGSRSKQVE